MHQVFQLVRPALIFTTLLLCSFAIAQDDSDLDVIEAELKKSKPVPVRQEETKRATVTETASGKPEAKIENISDLSRLAPFSEVSVLQKRFMPKTGRVQFYGGLSSVVNDPWNLGMGFSGKLAYGLTEAWGIEGAFTTISSSKKDVANDLKTNHDLDTTVVVTMKGYTGVNVIWTPYYGKMTLLNQRIIPFDHYFTFGVGNAALDGGLTSSATAFQFGTGQIFALTRAVAFRWDLSMHTYSAKQSDAASGSFNNILLTFGASLYIPEAKYR